MKLTAEELDHQHHNKIAFLKADNDQQSQRPWTNRGKHRQQNLIH